MPDRHAAIGQNAAAPSNKNAPSRWRLPFRSSWHNVAPQATNLPYSAPTDRSNRWGSPRLRGLHKRRGPGRGHIGSRIFPGRARPDNAPLRDCACETDPSASDARRQPQQRAAIRTPPHIYAKNDGGCVIQQNVSLEADLSTKIAGEQLLPGNINATSIRRYACQYSRRTRYCALRRSSGRHL